MKLSVCMILKDEAATIIRCLRSMESFVDEYIIGIDDKSTDDTEKLVNEFFVNCKTPNEVYKYKWQDSFCKARNEGMEKATGDYILIMDGHEYFPSSWYNITCQQIIPIIEIMPKIKELLDKEKPDEAYLQLYQQPFIGQVPNNFFLQPRIYRNVKEIKFGRAAHNTILGIDPKKSIHFDEVILLHDAPEGNRSVRSKQRQKMNVTALKGDLIKNTKDTRALFYLGNTYLEKGEYVNALKTYKKYLDIMKSDNSEKYQAYLHMAIANFKSKNYASAKDNLLCAIGVDNLRRDAYLLLGDLYCEKKEYQRGIAEYMKALSIKPSPSRMFQNGPAWTYEPIRKIAFACEQMGDIKMALRQWEAVYKFMPCENVAEKIKKLRGDNKNLYIVDAIGSFTGDIKKYYENRGYTVAISREFNGRLGAWADIIWQEWADYNAVKSSNQYPEKTIIRIHGYEWYINKNILHQINKKCRFIFVAKHIQKQVEEFMGVNGELIYNGVDLDKFYIRRGDRDPYNIGYAGLINGKKNPFLFCQIIKANPKFKFHIRADFQDPFLEASWKYELVDCKNVVYHGRYENIEDFWNQMSGVISTSIIESFSFNVAEAMACGCRPYIYNWEGASDIWKAEWIFKDMPKLKSELNPEEMLRFRKYIYDNYSVEKLYKALDKLHGRK